MVHDFLKSLALRMVSRGFQLPEGQIDRVTELTHLKTLLRELAINCVLDVGANRGQFARELRGIGYTGHIISFEPLPHEFARLSQRFTGDQKWKGRQLALGSEAKTAKINVARRSDLSSFLTLRQQETIVEGHEVEIKRLDNVLPELTAEILSPRIFLKMDTQGFDMEVFRGASACLKQILGLQSELSVKPIYQDMPHYLEALTLYEAAGFELYNLSVVARMFGKGLAELNCFMKRPSTSAGDAEDKETLVYVKHLAAGL